MIKFRLTSYILRAVWSVRCDLSHRVRYNRCMNPAVKNKLRDFFSKHRNISFRKGQIIISPDKNIEGVYLLISGAVRCYSISAEGVELSINSYKPVSFFPMNWVLSGTRDRFFYDCLENSKAYLAPKEDFLKFFTANPDLAFDLLARIYKGLDGYMLRMETLLGASAYVRLLAQLVIQARRSGSELRVPQRYLASETGLTRETITRQLKKLQQKKLVRYKGSTLLILDLPSLERELAAHF